MTKVRMFFHHELVAGGSHRKAGYIEGRGAKFVDLQWHRRKTHLCPIGGEETFAYWSNAAGLKLCRAHQVEEVFDPSLSERGS